MLWWQFIKKIPILAISKSLKVCRRTHLTHHRIFHQICMTPSVATLCTANMTCTSCLFPSSTTDAVSTTDHSMLRIVVLWQKYNKYVVKFTMICCRQGRDLNPGPLQTYYCWMRALWAAKDSPSKVQRSVVYYDP